MSSGVRAAYLAWWKEREKIKARHRVQLEEELTALSVALGREITLTRSKGATIDQVAAELGRKNKNFLYQMVAAYKVSLKKSEPDDETVAEWVFDIGKDADGQSTVTVRRANEKTGTNWIILNNDVPNEWVTESDPELKALYRKIVKALSL